MDLMTRAVSAPFEVGSAIRHARIFHPHGALFDGTAHFDRDFGPVPGGEPLPIRARLSRGIGTPRQLPDILGLAVRVRLPAGPWDLLFATAYLPARVALVPARTWASARYSTLAPYRRADDRSPRWLTATPQGAQPTGSAAIDELAGPLSFAVHLAAARGAPVPAGRFHLEHRLPSADSVQPSFDPVLNCPPGLEMWPTWLAKLRRTAYAGSRKGREAVGARDPERGGAL